MVPQNTQANESNLEKIVWQLSQASWNRKIFKKTLIAKELMLAILQL